MGFINFVKIGGTMEKLKKAILVYNPKSGNANTILSNFDLITTKLLKKGITLTLYSISWDYDLLTEILKNEKYDILILSGGDGTLSRCLSELYSKNIEFPEVAIFPTGTSNDFAKALNIGENIENWIEKITEKTAKYVDFGLINNKTVFLSSYAGGLFTQISYNTDKTLKKTFGKVAYYINGVGELTNIKAFDLNIVLDGNEKVKEKAILFVILNGKGVAGFDNVIDDASMNDGLMDILIIKNIDNLLDVPKILMDLMNNNLTDNDYTRTLRAKKCKIEKVKEDINLSIDGEEGENMDVEIEFVEKKLKVFH